MTSSPTSSKHWDKPVQLYQNCHVPGAINDGRLPGDLMQSSIRTARKEDVTAILSMLAELAKWEGAAHAPRLTPAALQRDVFGENPRLHILIAENQSHDPFGFISYYENYSSWEGASGIHIGDLWVSPSYRGLSIGAALLNHVTALYEDRRVDVFVIRDNEARFFYEHLGFKEQPQWVVYRKEPKRPL
jgi:ribosomal protein S18 acetylase RimI-like enzyme